MYKLDINFVRRPAPLRYFFNIRDARGLIADDEGSELPGMAAARWEADASARDFVMDDLRAGQGVNDRFIEITDGDGRILESVSTRNIIIAH